MNKRFRKSHLLILLLTFALIFHSCSSVAKKDNSTAGKINYNEAFSYLAYNHYVKGTLNEQAGDLAEATDEYRRALMFDNKSAEIRRALSKAYFNMRNIDEAFKIRYEIENKNSDDFNFLAECSRYNNAVNAVIAFYNQSLQVDSAQYLPNYFLARYYALNGNFEKSRFNFLEALKYTQDRYNSLLDMADFYFQIDSLKQALNFYDEAYNLDSRSIYPKVRITDIYIMSGDSIKADSLLSWLAENNWDNAEMVDSLVNLYVANGNFSKAELAARRVTELKNDDINAIRGYYLLTVRNGNGPVADSLQSVLLNKGGLDGLTYYYLARILQDKGDLEEAEKYYRQSVSLADTIPEAWTDLALLVDRLGRYEESLEIMRQALSAVRFDSIRIIYITSVIHGNNRRFELALDGFKRLSLALPEDVRIRFNLGSSYERTGQFENAEREFKWIIERYPDHSMALNYLAYMYAEKGINLEQALQMINKALSIEPENGAFLDTHAWILFRLGKHDEALAQMKKAVALEFRDSVIFDHLGDIYLALNEPEMAKINWEKALELDPENQQVRTKLNIK